MTFWRSSAATGSAARAVVSTSAVATRGSSGLRPDHLGDHRHEALPVRLVEHVVDAAGERGEHRVRALRVVAPALTGEE